MEPAGPSGVLDPGGPIGERLGRDRRVLLLGPSGSGKSSLAAALAGALAAAGRAVSGLAADPGAPAFGLPGSVSLGRWAGGAWVPAGRRALCTLDAVRFRLPLAWAVAELARGAGQGTLLVDTPGAVRGVAGAELLEALVGATGADLVLAIAREGEPTPLAAELAALGIEWVRVAASPLARRPGKSRRARARTAPWDAHLAGGSERWVAIDGLTLVGTPPRLAPQAWQGKQVAFLGGAGTPAMGEVLRLDGRRLRVRLGAGEGPTATLLIRDAGRDSTGRLATARPFGADLVRHLPPPDLLPDAALPGPRGPRPMVKVGLAIASLVNGVFDDPLLHLRLRQRRRSLLFDLGEGARLPARIAHQVTDCFVTHAHADHIGGFLWLLRSRIGEPGPCRLYGPPGLARHLEGFVRGILWDRIGPSGPVFEIAEINEGRVARFRLQAGQGGAVPLGDRPLESQVILDEPGFRVRAVALDHGTPVLAYAYEPDAAVKIRAARLAELKLPPGPWLTGLKRLILKGHYGAVIELPDGRRQPVGELAHDLALTEPGARLCYATDLADTAENRRLLVGLAAGAHTLFCEAPFRECDRDQARRTGHLTARACGEIAAAAGVTYLIPFHFSRRYEHDPWALYAEVAAACPQTVVPKRGPGGESEDAR